MSALRGLVREILTLSPQSNAPSVLAPDIAPPPVELVESMRRLLTVYTPQQVVAAIGTARGE